MLPVTQYFNQNGCSFTHLQWEQRDELKQPKVKSIAMTAAKLYYAEEDEEDISSDIKEKY